MSISLFSHQQKPLFWCHGRPIHAVSFLLGLYIASTIATAFLLALGRSDLVQLFVYNSTAVAHGELWRLVTYSFVNPPSIGFALEMGMFYFLGRLIETGIGSKSFVLFYGGLIILQGILFQTANLLGHAVEAHGLEMASLALFAAFVTMVPSISFFLGLTARWMLLLLMGISTLQFVAEHQWFSIMQLFTLVLVTIFFMKKNGYREPLYFFSSHEKTLSHFSPKPVTLPPPEMQDGDHYFTGSTIVASPAPQKLEKTSSAAKKTRPSKEAISMMQVDQLLDKINETGFDSLTEHEKGRLEAARLELLQRDKKSLSSL